MGVTLIGVAIVVFILIRVAPGNPIAMMLPPGATVCGSAQGFGNVFIASPLYGKDLEAYYRPIYEKLGCKPFTCEITDKVTNCKCAGNGKFGFVTTEERSEVFSVARLPSA